MAAKSFLPSPSASPADWLAKDFAPGRVSVVVPTFNRARLLGNALDSLETQTWRDGEIVVVDDGSTDDTLALLASRPPPPPGWTRVVLSQPNAGVAAARNTGTRRCTGEFIVYLDSDDILYPSALERYVGTLRETGGDYCYASIDQTDETGRPLSNARHFHPDPHAPDWELKCFWLVHGGCYRRAVVNAAGPWNENLRSGEDEEYLLRIRSMALRPAHLPTVQGQYRIHGTDQLHLTHGPESYFEAYMEPLDGFVAWAEASGRLDRRRRMKLAALYRFFAVRLLLAGKREAKHRALDGLARCCRGTLSPLRLMIVLRWVEPGPFARGLQRFWTRSRRRTGTAVKSAANDSRAGRRILVLSPVRPDPEGTGPSRRVHAVIEALSKQDKVSLFVVSGLNFAQVAPLPSDYLGGRVRFQSAPPADGRSWRARLARRFPAVHAFLWRAPFAWADLTPAWRKTVVAEALEMGPFEVVLAYRLCLAEAGREIARRSGGARLWLDQDDIDSLTYLRIAERYLANGDRRRGGEYRWAAWSLARLEKRLLPACERVFVCSETDRARLAERHAGVRVLPNIARVPESEERGVGAPAGTGFRFLFIGTLGYAPNQEALFWLGTEIWPKLGKRGAAGLVVAGHGQPGAAKTWLETTPGVEFLGSVARSADAFARADALLVPLRAGGGTRLKILEAFARGRPVVSTALGIEGIEAQSGTHYLRAETTDEFVLQAECLIRDPDLVARLAEAARALWRDRYSPMALERVVDEFRD